MPQNQAVLGRVLEQLFEQRLSFALAKAGRSIPARIAMMAMTTSNSIKVKAIRRVVWLGKDSFMTV